MIRILCISLVILLGANGLSVAAESQRALTYDYDEAGNLIAVRTIDIGGAPLVDDIQPSFLRRDASTRYTATGLNLNQVLISTSDPSVQISNVSRLSDTVVEFDLFTLSAPLGPTGLDFSNLLGLTQLFVTVAERLRIIASNPSPLILAVGDTATVSIRIDEPFESDKQFQVQISDTSIATINSSGTFTLTAGLSEVQVNIEGFTVGTTQLTVTQLDDSLTNSIAVSVLAPVVLAPGAQFVQARVVGVRVQRISISESGVYTPMVGVSRRTSVKAGESIESAPVGVEILTE